MFGRSQSVSVEGDLRLSHHFCGIRVLAVQRCPNANPFIRQVSMTGWHCAVDDVQMPPRSGDGRDETKGNQDTPHQRRQEGDPAPR